MPKTKKSDSNKTISNKRRDIKKKAVEYKGGKCEICGYNKCLAALTFHHIDPSKKNFNISAIGHKIPWSELEKELSFCQILCNNCHVEIHQALILTIKNKK